MFNVHLVYTRKPPRNPTQTETRHILSPRRVPQTPPHRCVPARTAATPPPVTKVLPVYEHLGHMSFWKAFSISKSCVQKTNPDPRKHSATVKGGGDSRDTSGGQAEPQESLRLCQLAGDPAGNWGRFHTLMFWWLRPHGISWLPTEPSAR